MKIALFSSKSYDSEYFSKAAEGYKHEITHFEARLRTRTADLEKGEALINEVICVEEK